jgi:CheY-like chemotaxis protein
LADHLAEIEAKGLRLRRDLGEAPLWIDGDRVRMAQVFDNLVANAIRFTDRPGEVAVSARREGGQVAVSVSDSGSGIDPDLLPYVFEPFRQAAQSIDRASGGLGLGLAIVKGVVTLHGGTAKAESAGVGRGAAFTVRLPLTAGPVAESSTPRADPRRQSSRMLIVEDNVDAADLLSDLLTALGHDVVVAYDGESAVKTAKSFAPEVVLCDIGLPGEMNGYDVARALRKEPATQRATLVAVTGYGRPEDASHAAEAGFDAHFTKPVDVASIQRLLPRRSARAG